MSRLHEMTIACLCRVVLLKEGLGWFPRHCTIRRVEGGGVDETGESWERQGSLAVARRVSGRVDASLPECGVWLVGVGLPTAEIVGSCRFPAKSMPFAANCRPCFRSPSPDAETRAVHLWAVVRRRWGHIKASIAEWALAEHMLIAT